jgi:hypothetical protein
VRAVLAAALVALAACGGSAAQPAQRETAAPRVVTLRHDGGTFTLRVGRQVEIHLPHWPWVERKPTSRAVEVFAINFFRDPGYVAWAVEARRPGRAVVPFTAGTTRFDVTFVVRRPSG